MEVVEVKVEAEDVMKRCGNSVPDAGAPCQLLHDPVWLS